MMQAVRSINTGKIDHTALWGGELCVFLRDKGTSVVVFKCVKSGEFPQGVLFGCVAGLCLF